MIVRMLNTILFMSNDVITVLQLFLGCLRRNGLAEVAVENISVVVHWILSVTLKLAKVLQLLTKTLIHTL